MSVPKPGVILGDRFELLELAGSGGMGQVYRAKDCLLGGVAAVKVVHPDTQSELPRFKRESEILNELSHPAIVRFLGQGATSSGTLFLAMEWLDGEVLSKRLRRQGLTFAESLDLAERVASGLAAAHEREIIHRDVKPSNLMLVNGKPEQVQILDFGIARLGGQTSELTRTGAIVGTPGYIAPEQARGGSAIDQRADIFSLGCVLFECLTGRPAFAGDHPLAILARILIDDSPQLSDFRPDLPPELTTLLSSMLAKEPEQRPSSMEAVCRTLSGFERSLVSGAPSRWTPEQATTQVSGVPIVRSERRIRTVLLLSLSRNAWSRRETPPSTGASQELEHLRILVETMGGQFVQLSSEIGLVEFRGRGGPLASATRAALCALSLRDGRSSLKVAIATGALELSSSKSREGVLEEAVNLLERAEENGIVIDEVTAHLLEVRFRVLTDGDVRRLADMESVLDSRRLLGKPTPCVGRAKERLFLEGTLLECENEPEAQVVVVTGSAGVGKSRICNEFISRVRDRDQARVLIARGDPVRTGSPLMLVAQLVHDFAGLEGAETQEGSSATLHRAVVDLLGKDEGERVFEFLAHAAGIETGESPSPLLIDALNDARVMQAQLTSSFVKWFRALCQRQLMLVVIEDLHWGDLPSLELLHRVIQSLSEEPLMLFGLSRPMEEIDQPQMLTLFDDAHELRLGTLKKGAARKLVHAVLGDDAEGELVDRIVRLSEGNAFFLEELIRHVAKGRRDFPETVLAMAQSRLDGLPLQSRVVLRAASLFGGAFWDSAVSAILGNALPKTELLSRLDELVGEEIIELNVGSVFEGEREYRFRHDLLRAAVYATVLDDDRLTAHRLAAEWLEQVGEKDARIIAEHYEEGGEPLRAVPHLVTSARAAISAGHHDRGHELALRGLECGATGKARGELLMLQALARCYQSRFDEVELVAAEAVEHLEPGEVSWFVAVVELGVAGTYGSNPTALIKALWTFQQYDGDLPPLGPVGQAGYLLFTCLLVLGKTEDAMALKARFERAAQGAEEKQTVFFGWFREMRVYASLVGLADFAEALPNALAACDAFSIAKDEDGYAAALFMLAWAELGAGNFQGAMEACRSTLELATRLENHFVEGWATYVYGVAQLFAGELEAGLETLSIYADSKNNVLRACVKTGVAIGLMESRELEMAGGALQEALDLTGFAPLVKGYALSVQAELLRRVGGGPEPLQRALAVAREATEHIDVHGCSCVYRPYLDFAHVHLARELGLEDEAKARLQKTKKRLLHDAAQLDEFARRESFLAAPSTRMILDS